MLRMMARRWMCKSRPKLPPHPGWDLDLKEYQYVDKTHLLARILSEDLDVSPGDFIHAPAMRRVGKSTTIQMLAAMARGEKDLFDEYAVNQPDSPFKIGEKQYPVIQLDFSRIAAKHYTVDRTEDSFSCVLKSFAKKQHEIHIPDNVVFPQQCLDSWISKLRQQQNNAPIVLLIDEYDAPVTTFLPEDPQKAQDIAFMMKPFFSGIKEFGPYFHKVFVTGVSKFANTSMFSGPNQFTPILEENPEFCTLYGFTEKEIRDTYGLYIEENLRKDIDTTLEKLRLMYNGYRNHPEQSNEDLVYNPWSVLKFLTTGKLSYSWIDTATTSTVAPLLGSFVMKILGGYEIDSSELFKSVAVTHYRESWKQVAFQAGYSTIKESKGSTLRLGPPNEEVRRWLEGDFVKTLIGATAQEILEKYLDQLVSLDFEQAFSTLEILLNEIPDVEQPQNESTFMNFAFSSLGQRRQAVSIYSEVQKKLEGESDKRAPRIDGLMYIKTSKTLVVFEFKHKTSIDKGLSQLKERQYMKRALKFMEEDKQLDVEKVIGAFVTLLENNRIKFDIVNE